MVKKWRRHSAAYKFRIALEVLESSKTIGQLSNALETWASLLRACIQKNLAGGQPHQRLNQTSG